MLITKSQLDTLLASDAHIAAYILRGRPPKAGDNITFEIDGKTQKVNIADIYLIVEEFGGFHLNLHKDQLALPVGKISGNARWSAKPVVSTPRTNTVTVVGGGGGGG